MLLTVIEALIFIGYLIFIFNQIGTPPSISDSWYLLDKKHKPFFTILFCYPVGLLHCLHGNWMFFLAGAGLCFVGAATDFKGWKHTKHVHYIAALICIVMSLAGLANKGIWWPALGMIAAVPTLSKTEDSILWIEVAAFVLIIGGLINMYL